MVFHLTLDARRPPPWLTHTSRADHAARLRATPALGPALTLHLGSLVALYVTAPYGKLVHAVYRFAALLRDAGER